MGYQPTKKTGKADLPESAKKNGKELDLNQTITDPEQLLEYFNSGITNPKDITIGMEVEKQGILRDTLKPVGYLAQNGTRKIQEKLIEELGWEIERQEGKYLTSMKRGATRMTLEFGESMSELSGRTHTSIHDLARELRLHRNEIQEISRLFNIVWLSIGYPPFELKKDEMRLLPIARFKVLHDYMKRRGKASSEIWKRACTVQANIDYTSEDDARKKFQVLLRLAPFLAAMYAHSPLKDGKDSGYISYRTHTLRKSDPRRMGIRKMFFGGRFGFKQWTDFCMRVPMIGIIREDKWLPAKKITFAQFMKSGLDGYTPTMQDWILHLSYIYTDVRIKNYIELRVCDSIPPGLIPSMQAIVKAFVYHKDGERAIKEVTKKWAFKDFASVYRDIANKGLQAERGGRKMLDYAKDILNIAQENLRSLKVLNEKGEDESIFLRPIKDFVFVKEKSPGEWVLENWNGSWKQNPERLIDWCSFEE